MVRCKRSVNASNIMGDLQDVFMEGQIYKIAFQDKHWCYVGEKQLQISNKDMDKYFEYIQTRYDRIITMSPEELAQFLDDWKCSSCMKRGNNCFPQNINNWLMEDAPIYK